MSLFFSKSHEWAKVEGNNVKVGISDYAQSELGDIVFIELPEVGMEINVGETLCEVESVKAVSEIYSPVKGKISSVNTALEDSPELINEDAMNEGWICTIEVESPPTGMLSQQEYDELIKG